LCDVVLAEQSTSQPVHVSRQRPAAGKLAPSRRNELRALLDGLARQIDEINANIANLGPGYAAAVRFRTVSLTAYRRAWAELTRDDIDFDGRGGELATLTRSRP